MYIYNPSIRLEYHPDPNIRFDSHVGQQRKISRMDKAVPTMAVATAVPTAVPTAVATAVVIADATAHGGERCTTEIALSASHPVNKLHPPPSPR